MRLIHGTILFLALPALGADKDAETFKSDVEPFLSRHCVQCHNAKVKMGEVDLEAYRNPEAALKERNVWEDVLRKVRTGEMPPPGRPKPAVDEIQVVGRWIEAHFARLDRHLRPDPGRVTARRLNRAEYNNTVRDLLGVDFRPADDFPADDSGYGFDNIGDVLSLSPVLMEKYLIAAGRIARKAIVADPPPKPTRERYQADRDKVTQPKAIEAVHRFPVDGEYEFRTSFVDRRVEGEPALRASFRLGGEQIQAVEFEPGPNRTRVLEFRIPVKSGEHKLISEILGDYPEPPQTDPKRDQKSMFVDHIEIRGPYDPGPWPLTESHQRILVCGHRDSHEAGCARRILGPLARRAFRRPVTGQEVDALVSFVNMAQEGGDSFEQGMRVALQAILVSPHFLFRIERDAAPGDPDAVHPVGQHELASRLSYFLWSSMPDEELLRMADQGRLQRADVVEAQVRRMLQDPRSAALVRNFAGQWLQIRNLDLVKPDPDRFPNFDEELRQAMRRETEMFFENIVREDRSILEFIDGRYTFLNGRLARHYGIPDVEGPGFRRVELDGARRSGVLTQASVLTVSSYATRTSPVLRGLWVLENLLGAPPPPPPPGVPNLNEETVGATGTLRQQLEQHRANPSCAVCHNRMDVLGFGLENYDAVGAWRTRDGKFPIDTAGTLPNGKSFATPAELKSILREDAGEFVHCLAEKMLTYALGRGLERYDRAAVNSISRKVAIGEYRFSRLILEIVKSLPFQMRRGEGGKG